MKTGLLVVLAILAGAAVIVFVVVKREKPKPEEDEERFLEARFISLGAGINEEALEVVLATVCESQRKGEAVRVLARRAGFEGERDFCIEYSSSEALRQDLARIRARLPRENATRPLPTLRATRACQTMTADPPYAEVDACKEK